MTINDLRIDPQNPSCFRNQSILVNLTRWMYDDSNQSIKSALNIFGNSFISANRTYQFMVRMLNKCNVWQQITRYVLVHIAETSLPIIIIRSNFHLHLDSLQLFSLSSIYFHNCVIQTMCIPNLEYQFVNSTTQVALYSFCFGQCPTLVNITWNIYQDQTNLSSNATQWSLLNSIQSYENIWFFGSFFKFNRFSIISNHLRSILEKLHIDFSIVFILSSCWFMAIWSCLLISQRTKLKCIECSSESTSIEWIVFDFTS